MLTFGVVVDPYSFDAPTGFLILKLGFVDWQGKIPVAMPEHAESHKWQCNIFGEEDSAHGSRDVGERIPDYSDDEVLEIGSLTYVR